MSAAILEIQNNDLSFPGVYSMRSFSTGARETNAFCRFTSINETDRFWVVTDRRDELFQFRHMIIIL